MVESSHINVESFVPQFRLRTTAHVAVAILLLLSSGPRCICEERPPEMDAAGKLKVLIHAKFKDEPLKKVLEAVCKEAGVELLIDTTDLAREGVDINDPVTLNLARPMTARSVLTLVLQTRGLGYVLARDSIAVHRSTRPDVYRELYDLTSVAKSSEEVNSVLQVVKRKIRDAEGEVHGADSRKVSSKGTAFIADQPQEVHELIADTLYVFYEQLRKRQEEEQLAGRRKEAQRWNAAAFRPSEEFSATDVSADLEAPIAEGRNQVYCASFQLAWAELVRVVGEPPKLAGDPRLAKLLNAGRIERETLSPDCFVAFSRPLAEETIAELKESILRKFPTASLPLPAVDAKPGYLIYAHMLKQLAFENDFERLKDGVKFRHGKHVASVASFGVEKYEDVMDRTIGKQVTVLDYRDDHDFIVKLHPKGERDGIVLAMVAPEKSLAKNVDVVQQRIKRGQEVAQRPHLESGESLKIPVLSLKARRDYSELTDRPFLHAGVAANIRQATQLISFRLNEQGAILESSAELEELLGIEIGEPPPIRHLVFDKPFLVMLKETGAMQPYLAMWIGNAELMEPMPADSVDR
jgi:hypothetical protein